MEAKIFQPIGNELRKATSSVAAHALRVGQEHNLFERFGSKGGDARRWLMEMAGLDTTSLGASVQGNIDLLGDVSTTATTPSLD